VIDHTSTRRRGEQRLAAPLGRNRSLSTLLFGIAFVDRVRFPAARRGRWVKAFRDALVEEGIPLAQFAVDDVEAEYDRLTNHGVTFTQRPTDVGEVIIAVFDDTCGNLIQIIAEKQAASSTD
jgi:hypothetical protein